jgi:hypothetical protein
MLHLNALPCSAGLLLAHLSLSTVSLLQMMCEQKGEGAPVWQDCLLSGALQLCIELQQQATLGIDKRAWLNEQHLLTVLQPWTALKELIGLSAVSLYVATMRYHSMCMCVLLELAMACLSVKAVRRRMCNHAGAGKGSAAQAESLSWGSHCNRDAGGKA